MHSIAKLSLLLAVAASPLAAFAAAPNAEKKNKDEVVFAKKEKSPKAHLQPRVYLESKRLQAGRTQRFAIVIDIEDGWHINTNLKRPSFIIPTQIKVAAKRDTKLKKVDYPRGKPLPIQGFDQPLIVYENQVILFGDLAIPESIAGQTEELVFHLKYQLCNDRQCLAPKTVKLKGEVRVVPASATVRTVNSEVFKKDPRRRQSSDS